MHTFAITLHPLGDYPSLPISESTFAAAKKSFQDLNQLLLLEERFDSLATNFLDFEALLTARLLQFEHIGFVDGNHQMYVRRDVNRVLMNVMTSARGYIDQLPQITNSIFGKKDPRSTGARDLLRKAYDDQERPGYRIFEALRNHIQHAGLPVHLIRYGTHMIGEFPKLIATKSAQVLLKPQTLAADKEFKPSILKELLAMGEQIDLRPLLCQYVAGIAEAHYYVRTEAKDLADAATLKLANLLNEYATAYLKEESLPGVVYAVQFKGDVWFDTVPLSTGNDGYLEYLRSINVHLDCADKHFLIGSVYKEA
jgi:hypothetical protein